MLISCYRSLFTTITKTRTTKQTRYICHVGEGLGSRVCFLVLKTLLNPIPLSMWKYSTTLVRYSTITKTRTRTSKQTRYICHVGEGLDSRVCFWFQKHTLKSYTFINVEIFNNLLLHDLFYSCLCIFFVSKLSQVDIDIKT